MVNVIIVETEMTAVRVFLGSLVGTLLAIPIAWQMMRQCRKPTGLLGRLILRTMDHSHAQLLSWGCRHVSVKRNDEVLDIGCGGGRTIHTIASLADLGTVHGVDYSSASVSALKALNRVGVEAGKVVIQHAAVSQLPFPNESFDPVAAVETYYYRPDLPGDMREIQRVLKPGGDLPRFLSNYASPNLRRQSQVDRKSQTLIRATRTCYLAEWRLLVKVDS